MVGRGEEEATLLGIEKPLQDRVGHRTRQLEVAALQRGFVKIDQAAREQRVILQVTVETRDAVLVRSLERVAVPQARHHELCAARGGLQVALVTERPKALGQRADHHSVPRGEDLFVARRLDPPLARLEQAAANLADRALHLLRTFLEQPAPRRRR